MAKLAISEAGLGRGKDLVARIKTYLPDLQNAAPLVTEFEPARAKLTQSPDDSAANLAAGRYFCLVKEDWKTGLPHLAKGSDASMAILARREIETPPAKPDDQIALADSWWDVGQSQEGVPKLAILRHARLWYMKADSILTGGLNKAKIGKRLDEIAKVEEEKSLAAASRSAVPLRQVVPLVELAQ